MHQPLLDAIAEFAEGYGKDERYKAVLEGLQGAVGGLKDMGPEGDSSPTHGQLAAKLAARPDAEVDDAKKDVPTPRDTPDQPKNFADATTLAKERMVAAR